MKFKLIVPTFTVILKSNKRPSFYCTNTDSIITVTITTKCIGSFKSTTTDISGLKAITIRQMTPEHSIRTIFYDLQFQFNI
jgi:hypothetical protein